MRYSYRNLFLFQFVEVPRQRRISGSEISRRFPTRTTNVPQQPGQSNESHSGKQTVPRPGGFSLAKTICERYPQTDAAPMLESDNGDYLFPVRHDAGGKHTLSGSLLCSQSAGGDTQPFPATETGKTSFLSEIPFRTESQRPEDGAEKKKTSRRRQMRRDEKIQRGEPHDSPLSV